MILGFVSRLLAGRDSRLVLQRELFVRKLGACGIEGRRASALYETAKIVGRSVLIDERGFGCMLDGIVQAAAAGQMRDDQCRSLRAIGLPLESIDRLKVAIFGPGGVA